MRVRRASLALALLSGVILLTVAAVSLVVVVPTLAHAQTHGPATLRVPKPGVGPHQATSIACTPWSVSAGQNPSAYNDSPQAVAALSSRNVWVVGWDALSNGDANTLIEHFDGSAWSVVPSPNATTFFNELTTIDALGPNDIWAVGTWEQASASTYMTLAEHWNGTAWSVVSTPNPSTTAYGYEFASVSGDASNDVWAVFNNESSSIVEHWNGSQWSLVTIPLPGDIGNITTAVVALSTTDAWIAGNYDTSSGGTLPLLEQWNGAAWSVVSPATPNWSNVALTGITATSSADIWAVGSGLPGTSQNLKPFAMQWNGATWSVASTPTGPGINTWLNGVAAANANEVWAVGETFLPAPLYRQPFVMRWTPSSGWQVMTTPTINQYIQLLGVSVVEPLNVWIIGQLVYNPTSQNPLENVLIEQYNPLLSIACQA